jgi:hypothetical protein
MVFVPTRVVEEDDFPRRREAVGHQRVPVVHVPMKCMLKTSGAPPDLPKRRYANRIPAASTNCIGAVW